MLLVLAFFVAVGLAFISLTPEKKSTDTLLLLTTDHNHDFNLVKGWLNVAAELGLHLEVKTDGEYLYQKRLGETKYKGIILPDFIHIRASLSLLKKLSTYVQEGGHLMIIYDAATKDLDAKPFNDGPLFANMMNLKYGPSTDGEVRGVEHTIVGNKQLILEDLGIPPGKYMSPSSQNPSDSGFKAISTYGYGPVDYAHFTTPSLPDGTPLLLTTLDNQFIAGTVDVGTGQILFVNLPLTGLWVATDSMLFHVFLHYFAVDMIHLPVLSTVPNGIGGQIMNLHVETKSDVDIFPKLDSIGLFEQGPYSIDFTAGPDWKIGDNLGVDVLHNPQTQYWMQLLSERGNAIGSDGGWIHDYFGLNVTENNQKEFQSFITKNIDAIEQVVQKKVLEYVPSMGNQPSWAVRYLEKRGFIGYYSLSNTGTGPTQNFRNGVFDDPTLWSYAPLPLGKEACFRDFGMVKKPVAPVTEWLIQSTEFVANHHTARLIYFHPSDLSFFPEYISSLEAWLTTAKALSTTGVFQWYSMVGLSEFLNSRRKISWSVSEENGVQTIRAMHPDSLGHQAWLILKDVCQKPQVTIGNGNIREDGYNWIVTAEDVKKLEFRCVQPDTLNRGQE